MSLNWLLIFLPIGIGLNWVGASPILVFADFWRWRSFPWRG